MTPKQVQVLISLRGKTGAPLVDYTLEDNSDGAGVRIAQWSEAMLGPLPTQAECDAITPAQVAAYDSARRLGQFAATSRQKDILAMVALVVRAKGAAAWNAMSPAQKVAATLAEADVWANIRDFIESNA